MDKKKKSKAKRDAEFKAKEERLLQLEKEIEQKKIRIQQKTGETEGKVTRFAETGRY